MNNFKNSIVLLITLLMISCTINSNNTFTGIYSIDEGKSAVQNLENNEVIYRILIVKPDMTFIIKTNIDDNTNTKVGSWKISKNFNSQRKNGSVIEFRFTNSKVILGSKHKEHSPYYIQGNFNESIKFNSIYTKVNCDSIKWKEFCYKYIENNNGS